MRVAGRQVNNNPSGSSPQLVMVCGELIDDLFIPCFQQETLLVGRFHAADYFSFNAQLPGSLYHPLSSHSIRKDLQAMPHIENLVHFPVVGAGSFLYKLEDQWRFEKIILDDLEIARQIFHAFGLPPAAAMNETMYLVKLFRQQLL